MAMIAHVLMLYYICLCKGGMSVAVPGEVAGYYEAWRHFGRLPWRRLLQPTIDMCRHGYEVQWSLAAAIKAKELIIRQTPSLRYFSGVVDINNFLELCF